MTVHDVRNHDNVLVVDIRFEDFTDSERALFHREIDYNIADDTEALRVRLEVAIDPEDPASVLISRWCPGRSENRNMSRDQAAAIGWRYLPASRQGPQARLEGAGGIVQVLLSTVESDLGSERDALIGILESLNDRLAHSHVLADLRKGMADHLSNSMPRVLGADDLALRASEDPSASVLDKVSMYLVNEGGFAPLSHQSDGMKQLLSMTLFDLAEGTANVIAIDEPEMHLHPQSQRTVATLLSSGRNQKILVTHSPYVVQRFQPEQIVTVRADGTCRQIPAATRIQERSQALWWSPRMLEALTARFVVVVEGAADRIVLEAAAQALGVGIDRNGIVVLELDGAAKFKDVYRLLGPDGFDLEILGLVDEDEKSSWLGAFGGSKDTVLNRTLFVSNADLEDEYCRGLGVETVASLLINTGVARDADALVSSCAVSSVEQLTPAGLAKFCRTKGGKNVGIRKVPAALAVVKELTKAQAESITSIHRLLVELQKRLVR